MDTMNKDLKNKLWDMLNAPYQENEETEEPTIWSKYNEQTEMKKLYQTVVDALDEVADKQIDNLPHPHNWQLAGGQMKVDLIDFCGNDKTFIQAARVSLDQDLQNHELAKARQDGWLGTEADDTEVQRCSSAAEAARASVTDLEAAEHDLLDELEADDQAAVRLESAWRRHHEQEALRSEYGVLVEYEPRLRCERTKRRLLRSLRRVLGCELTEAERSGLGAVRFTDLDPHLTAAKEAEGAAGSGGWAGGGKGSISSSVAKPCSFTYSIASSTVAPSQPPSPPQLLSFGTQLTSSCTEKIGRAHV